MLQNVFPDMRVVESMRHFNLPLVERSFAHMTEVLSSAYDDPPSSSARRAALVAVAVSFDTWRTMTRQERLADAEAVETMVHAVDAVRRA